MLQALEPHCVAGKLGSTPNQLCDLGSITFSLCACFFIHKT